MKKEFFGYLALILSGLLLSLELYGLKFIQYLDIKTKSSYYTNPIYYIYEVPILLAILITVTMVIFGFNLIIPSKKSNKNKEKA